METQRPPPDGNLDEHPLPLDHFVERCKASWEEFKLYVRGMTAYAIGHALSVVRAWYPTVELEQIDGGFPKEIEDNAANALQREAEECAVKLVDDLYLFG